MTSSPGPIDLLDPSVFARCFALPENEAVLLDLLNSLLHRPPPLVAAEPAIFTPPPPTSGIPTPALSVRCRDERGGQKIVRLLCYREFLPIMEKQVMWLASQTIVEEMDRNFTRTRVTPTAVVALCGISCYPDDPPLLSEFSLREATSGRDFFSLMPMEIVYLDLSRAPQPDARGSGEARWAQHIRALREGTATSLAPTPA